MGRNNNANIWKPQHLSKSQEGKWKGFLRGSEFSQLCSVIYFSGVMAGLALTHFWDRTSRNLYPKLVALATIKYSLYEV